MLVLLAVGVPSISLIYGLEEVTHQVSLTLRLVGRQWYWVYNYPVLAADGLASTALELEAALRSPLDAAFSAVGARLLSSVPLLLPVNLLLQLLVTGEDVIHSLALPSLGLKMDAVPGRLNTVYALLERSGIFAGQCSELCGAGHSLMPIVAVGTDGETVINYLLEELGVLQSQLQGFLDQPPVAEMRSTYPRCQCADCLLLDAQWLELHGWPLDESTQEPYLQAFALRQELEAVLATNYPSGRCPHVLPEYGRRTHPAVALALLEDLLKQVDQELLRQMAEFMQPSGEVPEGSDAADATASAEAQERQRTFAAADGWGASQCRWWAEQSHSQIMANGPEAPRLAIAPAAATAAADVSLQATAAAADVPLQATAAEDSAATAAAAGEAQEASLQQAKRDCLARCFSSPPADGGFSSVRNPRTGTFRLWSDCVFQCDPNCGLTSPPVEKLNPAPAAADASTASLGFFLGSPSL